MSRAFVAAVAFALGACLAPIALAGPGDPVKVVYHLNEGNDQASNALRNMGNHLSADPTAKIVVVTHAAGINFLLDGAVDKNGGAYSAAVDDMKAKGVDFRVCNFTLLSRKIDPSKVIGAASIVPSGVAEVAKLQAKEGFVYLRP